MPEGVPHASFPEVMLSTHPYLGLQLLDALAKALPRLKALVLALLAGVLCLQLFQVLEVGVAGLS